MKKSGPTKFKVTKPVSAELKNAIVAYVKDPATKKKTTRHLIVAMASVADRKATINAIKTLVNQDMLKLSTPRYPKSHDKVYKPFEERLLSLPGPERRGRPKANSEAK